MNEKWKKYGKRYRFPIVVLIGLLLIVILFHEVLRPFVIALVVVYLMEPLVCWMNAKRVRGKQIPRGAAVIIVYLVFLMSLTGLGFLFVPSLVAEIGQATETLPKYIAKVKDEDLPRWSEKFDRLMFSLSFHDRQDVKSVVDLAEKSVLESFQKALELESSNTVAPVDLSGRQPLLLIGEERQILAEKESDVKDETAIFKLKKGSVDGEYYVILVDKSLEIVSEGGVYRFQQGEDHSSLVKSSDFNLEKEINQGVVSLLESSKEYAGSALTVLQYLVQFLINAFVELILVFMLAAFISIDMPALFRWTRKMFEDSEGYSAGYDELVARFNRGLSGVIRGQIIICIINGVLTGLGLWVLGVDFAMLLGIIAGILSIIPIFGTIVSTIPAVLLGLVQGFSTGVLVLLWILFVHFIDANFNTPKIVGSSAHLHPVVIIFAILAGQASFGVLGAILGVPVASIIQTVMLFIRDRIRAAQLVKEGRSLTEMGLTDPGISVVEKKVLEEEDQELDED